MNIIADLHTHTVSSGHAYSTLMENIGSAMGKGLQFLGVSDHAPALAGAPEKTFFDNLGVVRRYQGALKVMHGVELNILNEYGDIDLPDDSLSQLDYAIASLHDTVFPEKKMGYCTDAAIAAMSNPYVYILGHPDDDYTPFNYEALVSASKRFHVALEVNNASLCPRSFRKGAAKNYIRMLGLAKKLGAPIIVSSDSHISYDIGNFTNALNLLYKIDFPKELVVNSSHSRLYEFFTNRKNAALSASEIKLREALTNEMVHGCNRDFAQNQGEKHSSIASIFNDESGQNNISGMRQRFNQRFLKRVV